MKYPEKLTENKQVLQCNALLVINPAFLAFVAAKLPIILSKNDVI